MLIVQLGKFMSQSVAFINPRLSTSNVGDIFIEKSVKKIVNYNPETSVDIDPRKPVSKLDIERINNCDYALIVGTNLWYQDIYKENRWMITPEQLKNIKVPIIPYGVGTTVHNKNEFDFNKTSKYIIELIHDSCEMGSVRDPETQRLLERTGIYNSVMTGCPTVFRSLKDSWKLNLKNSKSIALTARKGHNKNIRELIGIIKNRGYEITIPAQKENDLFCSSKWGIFGKSRLTDSVYIFDDKPYETIVDNSYGAIGWRLHGNIFHLSKGNPTFFFANCSRVMSFCEAFGLPYIYAEDGTKISQNRLEESVNKFFNADYYDDFSDNYKKYYAITKGFFEKNGINNNLV